MQVFAGGGEGLGGAERAVPDLVADAAVELLRVLLAHHVEPVRDRRVLQNTQQGTLYSSFSVRFVRNVVSCICVCGGT